MNTENRLTQWLANKKLVAGIFVVIILLIVIFSSGDDGTVAQTYHQVERSDFLVSVVEGGNLEAVNEVVIRNELEGSSRIIYIVPEGTFVTNGQLLVELDAGDVEEKLNQEQISFEKSMASYIASTNSLLITRSTVESEIRNGQLLVQFAQMDVEKFRELEKENEERAAEIDIITVQESLANKKETLEITERLVEEGFEAKNKLDTERLSVTNSALQLEKAESLFAMLTRYDLKKREAQNLANFDEAIKDLERVTKQGESKIAQAMADVRSEENTLTLNSNKLEKTKAQLAATKVHAPQSGLVVYAISQSRYSSESLIEEGATVRNRQELIKLPDTSQMKVVIKVHESHINQVTLGQTAFVVLDSMPDERFKGQVTKVALLPDGQSRFGNPNLKVYSTEVLITDPLPDVKPGVSARAEIVVTNLVDVVKVPIQCITTLKGQQVAFVKKGRDDVPVPVEVGLYNNKYIEILSGLDANEQVLLAPPLNMDMADLDGSLIQEGDKENLEPEPGVIPPAPIASGSPGEATRPGAAAGEAPRGNARGQEGGAQAGGGDRRAEMLRRFDRDGDGRLSDEERTAMRQETGGAAGGAGGGGGGNFSREEMMKRFDKNGDGQIDESEREAIRQQFGGGGGGNQGRRSGAGAGGGGGGGGNREERSGSGGGPRRP